MTHAQTAGLPDRVGIHMKDLGALGETVEAVRARSFPDLPEALVATILEIEASSHEDRLRARDFVTQAITDHLKPATS